MKEINPVIQKAFFIVTIPSLLFMGACKPSGRQHGSANNSDPTAGNATTTAETTKGDTKKNQTTIVYDQYKMSRLVNEFHTIMKNEKMPIERKIKSGRARAFYKLEHDYYRQFANQMVCDNNAMVSKLTDRELTMILLRYTTDGRLSGKGDLNMDAFKKMYNERAYVPEWFLKPIDAYFYKQARLEKTYADIVTALDNIDNINARLNALVKEMKAMKPGIEKELIAEYVEELNKLAMTSDGTLWGNFAAELNTILLESRTK